MSESASTPFDPEEHERQVEQRYYQLAKYKAFDRLVDLALDGIITLEEAKAAWLNEIAEHNTVHEH